MATQASIRINDPILPGLVVGGMQDDTAFQALNILKPVYVGGRFSSCKVVVENPQIFMGDPSQSMKRPPGAPMKELSVGNPRDPVTITCETRSARAEKIPIEHAERSQFGVDESGPPDLTADELDYLQSRSASALAEWARIVVESDVASLMQTGWDNTVACTDLDTSLGGTGVKWSNISSATPILDLHCLKVYARVTAHGRNPKDLILPQQIVDYMARSAEVRGYFLASSGAAFGGAQTVTDADVINLVKQRLGLNVYVPGARYRTSVPDAAYTEDYIFTDTIWMGCLETPAAPMVSGNRIRTQAKAAMLTMEKRPQTGIEYTWEDFSFHPWINWSYGMGRLEQDLGVTMTDVL